MGRRQAKHKQPSRSETGKARGLVPALALRPGANKPGGVAWPALLAAGKTLGKAKNKGGGKLVLVLPAGVQLLS